MSLATTADIWRAVRQEREALTADLETFTPEQWDAQSLCAEWRVRDVVGHLIGGIDSGAASLLLNMPRHGFNLSRVLSADARRRGSATPTALRERYRALVDSRRTPIGAKPVMMLNDIIIHGQDIRRPIGVAHAFPPEHLTASLDSVRSINLLIGTVRRIAGLHLQATDCEWSTGSGPEVSGPGEALLMAMTGRGAALTNLSGEGVAMMRERMPAT